MEHCSECGRELTSEEAMLPYGQCDACFQRADGELIRRCLAGEEKFYPFKEAFEEIRRRKRDGR
jgi:hypothetical protein